MGRRDSTFSNSAIHNIYVTSRSDSQSLYSLNKFFTMLSIQAPILRGFVSLAITMVVVQSSHSPRFPSEPGMEDVDLEWGGAEVTRQQTRAEGELRLPSYQGELSLTFSQDDPSTQPGQPKHPQMAPMTSFQRDFYGTGPQGASAYDYAEEHKVDVAPKVRTRKGDHDHDRVDLQIDSPRFPAPSAPPAGESSPRAKQQAAQKLTDGAEKTLKETEEVYYNKDLILLSKWDSVSLKVENDGPAICNPGGCCRGAGACGPNGTTGKFCGAVCTSLGCCCCCFFCCGAGLCHDCEGCNPPNTGACVPTCKDAEWESAFVAPTGSCMSNIGNDKGSITLNCKQAPTSKIDTKHAVIGIDAKKRALVIDLKVKGKSWLGECGEFVGLENGNRWGWKIKTACSWLSSLVCCCMPWTSYVQPESGLYQRWVIPFEKGFSRMTYEKSQMRDGTFKDDIDNCACCCCCNPICKGLCFISPRRSHVLKFNVEGEGFELADSYYRGKEITLTLTEKYSCCRNNEFWKTFDSMTKTCTTTVTCGCTDICSCLGPMVDCLQLLEMCCICCAVC